MMEYLVCLGTARQQCVREKRERESERTRPGEGRSPGVLSATIGMSALSREPGADRGLPWPDWLVSPWRLYCRHTVQGQEWKWKTSLELLQPWQELTVVNGWCWILGIIGRQTCKMCWHIGYSTWEKLRCLGGGNGRVELSLIKMGKTRAEEFGLDLLHGWCLSDLKWWIRWVAGCVSPA